MVNIRRDVDGRNSHRAGGLELLMQLANLPQELVCKIAEEAFLSPNMAKHIK